MIKEHHTETTNTTRDEIAMQHDDDTSERATWHIPPHSNDPTPIPAQLPSSEVQEQIRRLGEQPGVWVERIFARFRRKGEGISRQAIAYVLEQEFGTPPPWSR